MPKLVHGSRPPKANLARDGHAVHRKKTVNRLPGFSLVEVLLSMFLILAIVSIFLASAATYRHSRITALQSLATNIASRDLENQKKLAFSAVSTNAITDSDSGKLPAYTGQRTVALYEANTKIKQVTDVITWVEKGVTRQIILETLISENGL